MPYLYDFNLSSNEELRARRVHDEAVVIDIVNMGVGGSTLYNEPELANATSYLPDPSNPIEALLESMLLPYEMDARGESSAIRRWWDESGMAATSFSLVSINDAWIDQIAKIEHRLLQCDWLAIAKSAEDIRRNKANKKHSFFFFCQPQPGWGLTTDLKQLEKAKKAGLTSLMLTYNRMDLAGVGCIERVDAGLSYLGVDIVKACEALEIVVDVSHCGKATTLDACRIAKKPVTSNHTCAEAIYASNRAKSDEEIKAIAATGGLIGIVAVPFFISEQNRPTIEVMLDHIDHVCDLVGWQHVGIGSDWPFQAPAEVANIGFMGISEEMGFRKEDNLDTSNEVRGFEDSRCMRNVSRGLVKRGYQDEQIAGILGENYMRVLSEIQQ